VASLSKELAMCYLVRQQQPEPKHDGAPATPGLDRLRPRWIGVGAAALATGLAVAASLVSTPASAPIVTPKEPAAAAALVPVRDSALPTAGGGEQRSAPVDDGVPGSDVVKAGKGDCHHGL
jgi:hypothetical protein